MAKLNVSFGGLELESPLIVCSGPCTRTVHQMRKAAEAGAGAVTTKGTFLDSEYRELVKPNAPYSYPEVRPKYVRGGKDIQLHAATYCDVPAEKMVDRIKQLKRDVKIPVIASEIAITETGYVKMGRMYEDAGADAIELDFCCPMPIFKGRPVSGRTASISHPETVGEIVKNVKEEVSIPVGIKPMFHPIDPYPLLNAAKENKADYINILQSNSALSPIDIETGKPHLPATAMGISGPTKRLITYMDVSITAREFEGTKIDVTASGCALSWKDCIEYMMYGCSTVGLNHAIMSYGFGVITKINKEISVFMDRKGYMGTKDFQGVALKYQTPYDRFLTASQETKGKIIAEVNKERCTLCGICENTCLWEAITIKDEKVAVDGTKCEGCRLCVVNCPEDAIKLKNTEILFS